MIRRLFQKWAACLPRPALRHGGPAQRDFNDWGVGSGYRIPAHIFFGAGALLREREPRRRSQHPTGPGCWFRSINVSGLELEAMLRAIPHRIHYRYDDATNLGGAKNDRLAAKRYYVVNLTYMSETDSKLIFVRGNNARPSLLSSIRHPYCRTTSASMGRSVEALK
jgi:hypothetical protein